MGKANIKSIFIHFIKNADSDMTFIVSVKIELLNKNIQDKNAPLLFHPNYFGSSHLFSIYSFIKLSKRSTTRISDEKWKRNISRNELVD